MLEVAELYRELGRYEAAADALKQFPSHDIGVAEILMERLINEGQRALIRFRM